MKYPYIVKDGCVKEENNDLVFEGKTIELKNSNSTATTTSPLYSSILFPYTLNSGSIRFDVEFSSVCDLTRCGFILQYSFVDGKERFVQACIRNGLGFCGLDYYNGLNWEFLTAAGNNNQIEARKKYSLELTVQGNILTFSVNGVPMYVYTQLRSMNGVCGISTYNIENSTISNVQINVERPTAFVIMKFGKDFDELYQDVIAPICKDFNYKALRADECYTSSAIIQDIIREIANASLIIADVTMDNPNVFYELGYAHALNKPTILLADTGKRERLPFDISGFRTILYENTIRGKREIENILRKFIENIHSRT